MRRGLRLAWGSMLATVVTALVIFWLAYDDATYGLVARNTLAIAIWWAIGLGVAVGLLRLPSSRAFWGVAGLLAAFAAWTCVSMAWAASNERAFNEMNRVLLYLGVFLLAGMLVRHAALSRWADGVALGIVAIAGLALAQRFFPDVFPRGQLDRYTTGPQLSYPVEYVNGLGIFAALSLPLLLRAAVASRSTVARALAVAPIPAVAAVVYLTSSRGAVIVAATGVVLFLILTSSRWAAAGAFAVAAAGSAGAVAVIANRPELVDEPLSRAAEDQGPGAALLLLGLCAASGLGYIAGVALLHGRTPRPAFGWATVAFALFLAIVAVAAAEPVESFDTFRKVPGAGGSDEAYTVRGHLLSANSTGRWQFWKAAAQQFEEHPLAGDGAGSYEAWWAQHGTFAIFVADAHSLYFETLGELGVVGLALLLAALVLAGIAAITPIRGSPEPIRSASAAIAALFAAYSVSAALDWMWEFTIVSVVGFAAVGWSLGRTSDLISGLPSRVLVPFLALAVTIAQAIPLATTLAIRDSQAAAREERFGEALEKAETARDVQRWAAAPHLQLALVLEQAGRLAAARQAIGDAIEHDSSDWRLWLVQARLQAKSGDIGQARASLGEAAMRNPRSPLFSGR